MDKLATLVPLKDTTKSTDLYMALQSTLKTCQFKINGMSAITADYPSIVRQQRRSCSYSKKIRRRIWEQFHDVHCIVLQKLCVQNPSLVFSML
jgi:hypothetical protein